MAKKIGEAFGEFLEVDYDQENFCWGESLRIKILMDITKSLRRGVWIELGENQESLWIQAKYERLPDFCYGCGRIGHIIKECRTLNKETDKDPEGWQFGSWLRFQGLNPRRRRKDQPQSNSKEKSHFDSSSAKSGSFSSNDRIADSIRKTPEERRSREKEEGINQQFQMPSSHFDLNLGPQEADLFRVMSALLGLLITTIKIWLVVTLQAKRLLSPLL